MLAWLSPFIAYGLVATPTPIRLPADVDDAYALRFNPAGLGYLRGSELRLRYGQTGFGADAGEPLPTRGMGVWGASSFGALTLGGGLDFDVDDNERSQWSYVLGLGLRMGRFSLGLSWDRLYEQGVDEAFSRVNAGVNLRWTSWMSTGLSVRNLTQHRERRLWDLGLAFRPLDRLLISGRWRLPQGVSVTDDPDLAAMLAVEPIQGIHLGVVGQRNPSTDFALTAQLEVTFGRLLVGASGQTLNDTPSVVTELVFQSEERPAVVTPARVAVLDLVGDLQPESRIRLLPPSIETPPYGDIPLVLDALAKTERVKGVWVRIGALSAGWARAKEARDGLLNLKKKGRRIDCLLGGTNDVAYYVATVCDAIIISPAQVLRLDGVAARVLFLQEALERAGVQAQVVRHGRYKSAPDQFTRSGMSAPQREALGMYLDDVYEALVTAIVEGRKKSRDDVVRIFEQGVQTATDAVSLGLVDKVLYPDEIDEHLEQAYGKRPWLTSALDALTPTRSRWGRLPRIAVVHVDAAISSGDSSELPFGLGRTVGASTLLSVLDRLKRSPSVRAVVLRVDSPGGDALASDMIARAVAQLQKIKPVVVSFGDVAASGGYYVAAGAGTIFAEPTTLTGSIGVYSLGFSFERLLARWGIRSSVVARGSQAASGSALADWTDEERQAVQRSIDFIYERFLQTVAEGRKIDREALLKLAEGRIWSGVDAKAHGLVDELGGFVQALQFAKRKAGLPEDSPLQLVVLPRNTGSLIDILRTDSKVDLGILPDELMHWARMAITHRVNPAGVSASLPWDLNID